MLSEWRQGESNSRLEGRGHGGPENFDPFRPQNRHQRVGSRRLQEKAARATSAPPLTSSRSEVSSPTVAAPFPC